VAYEIHNTDGMVIKEFGDKPLVGTPRTQEDFRGQFVYAEELTTAAC